MIDLNVPIAFVAGLVSFFAPCAVPLLPAYVGYVTGVSLGDLEKYGYGPFRKKLLINSLFYILGFSLVFVLLGILSAGVGVFFRRYDFILQPVSGLVVLILGLEFAGVIRLPLFLGTQFTLPRWRDSVSLVRAFFVGVIFASIWTPCVGAVLGSILAIAATTGSIVRGAWLLFFYSLGISLPFLIVSLTLLSSSKNLSFISRKSGILSRIAGILLALLGILLITDTYKYINFWIIEVLGK